MAKTKKAEILIINPSNQVGRPTKYDKDFHPKDFIRLSKMGYTKAMIVEEWDLSIEALCNWQKDQRKQEFIQAVKKGNKYLESHLTKMGYDMARGLIKGGNVAAWIWLTKNCINWREKSQLELSNGSTDKKVPMAFEFNESPEEVRANAVIDVKGVKK